MSLSGWGLCPVQRCRTYRPERWREIQEIVTSNDSRPIIARGAGRSYGDAALNDQGTVLLSTRLRRLLDFDEPACEVECEAGVTFDDLLRTFVPRGLFPPVTPGTKFVTVGGATAADVHGKNHHRDGSFASHVVALTLLRADGTIIRCSPEFNSDAFYATTGGMGLTGLILAIRFRMRRIESSFLMVDYDRAKDLEDVLRRFEDDDSKYEYSVAWMDCAASGSKLGRSILMRANAASANDLSTGLRHDSLITHDNPKLSIPFAAPAQLLSKGVARLFNGMYFYRHRNRRSVPVHYGSFFYPLDAISNWNRVYGSRGLWQFQVVFDRAAGQPGMAALLECLRRSKHACLLAVVKAFGKSSGGILSFPRRGYTVSLDIPNRRGSREFLGQLEEIVREHGGRVYLAKDARLTRSGFEEMYPSADEFKRIKAQLDPGGCFGSSLARRIGLA